jgi:hypothetical protein
MFTRIHYLLAAFNRGEFGESELARRLRDYAEQSDRSLRPSRKVTHLGPLPILWCEP